MPSTGPGLGSEERELRQRVGDAAMEYWHTISEQSGQVAEDGSDRQDQALGRIIRLLLMLPVRELDALADRLERRVQEPTGGARTRADTGRGAGLGRSSRAMAAAESGADMVGQ